VTSRIEALLEEVRLHLDRVHPDGLASASGAGALIVDIRPVFDRESEGTMPGAVVIDRNVLEWRLDPTSPDRIDEWLEGRRIVLFCNDGYASTLAARTLQVLGLEAATDLVGGYRGWLRYLDRLRGDPGTP
jgi:rhodanese-related sulfurtransferase